MLAQGVWQPHALLCNTLGQGWAARPVHWLRYMHMCDRILVCPWGQLSAGLHIRCIFGRQAGTMGNSSPARLRPGGQRVSWVAGGLGGAAWQQGVTAL